MPKTDIPANFIGEASGLVGVIAVGQRGDKMDDLISRQAAIDNLMEIIDRPNHAEFLYTDEICGVLCNLPSAQPDIDEFLRNKSPKEHREILHWIAIHYYPRDSKEVLQAISNMVRPDTKPEPYRGGEVEPISYLDCSNAMLKMWMDNVVTDGEYNRIMDKLNKKHEEDMRGEQDDNRRV